MARYPQKFGRKYSAHPAYRAKHGDLPAAEPIELEILSTPEPKKAPEPKVEEKPVPVAKADPPKQKKAPKRSVSSKLEKNEKSKG